MGLLFIIHALFTIYFDIVVLDVIYEDIAHMRGSCIQLHLSSIIWQHLAIRHFRTCMLCPLSRLSLCRLSASINLFSHGFSVGFLVNISFFIWVLYDIHYIISECGEQSSH